LAKAGSGGQLKKCIAAGGTEHLQAGRNSGCRPDRPAQAWSCCELATAF
jgi:hypothetical protein